VELERKAERDDAEVRVADIALYQQVNNLEHIIGIVSVQACCRSSVVVVISLARA